ncbi:MAG: hypothetical protein U9R42_12815, partial [Bacteroidota bacterium]|nr:hypothetical protein [Bacteroidota bacterium]
MPKRQSGLVCNNIAVTSEFNEVEYSKIVTVHDNLDAIQTIIDNFSPTLEEIYINIDNIIPV